MNKKIVEFIARKKIVEPVEIKFRTSEGKLVTFIARRETTKPIKIKFKTNK